MIEGVALEASESSLLVILLFVKVLVEETVGTTTPSTARTHAEEREIVVSDAFPSSILQVVKVSQVPLRAMFLPSTATTQADTREIVVSEAFPSSIFPVVVKTATPLTLLESSIITQLFCIILPVVESKRATALSVEDAAHSVFVVFRFVKFVFMVERELVTVSVQAIEVIVDILWYYTSSIRSRRCSCLPSIPSQESVIPCISRLIPC